MAELSAALDDLATVRSVSSGTTLVDADRFRTVEYTGSGAANITVSSTLAAGFYAVTQTGAGQITVVAGSGATVTAETGGGLKSQGQPSLLTIWVKTPATAYVFGGTT